MAYARLVPLVAVAAGILAVACSSVSDATSPSESAARSQAAAGQPVPPASSGTVGSSLVPVPSTDPPKLNGSAPKLDETSPVVSERIELLDDEPPRFLTFGWKTDFSRHSVPFDEILSGGPPRDGIPPIDNPKYHDVSDAPTYMVANEPVISVEINGDARAFPLAILISHEIVNDEIGGVPVTITYCPLCNTAIVFDRRVGDRVLDFGTSGNLRHSDLVMWDRQTESWWQQISGEAIVGELTGTKLTFIPAPLVSWSAFRDSFPDGKVLSRDTGFARNYDLPPYSGYDELGNIPFLFSGDIDDRLQAVERVVTLNVGDVAVAYPFEALEDQPVINDTINGQDVVIFFAGGTLSAFAGRSYSDNRAVGSTGVYEPVVDGQKLTFKVEADVIVDEETGSKWNILGIAVEGPLEGSRLAPVVHANHFWFAWAAFNPETEIRTGAAG